MICAAMKYLAGTTMVFALTRITPHSQKSGNTNIEDARGMVATPPNTGAAASFAMNNRLTLVMIEPPRSEIIQQLSPLKCWWA